MRVQAACNRVRQPCGCVSWDEMESGEWVRRDWLCSPHLIDWLRSDEGEAWSRDRARWRPSGAVPATAMFRAPGPVNAEWDPCGRHDVPPFSPGQIKDATTGTEG